MTLAAILLVCFLSLSGPTFGQAEVRGPAAQDQNSTETPQSQTPPVQSTNPEPASSAPAGQPQNSPSPAKPSPKRQGHRKKTGIPDCSNTPTALNPAGGSPNSMASPGAASAGPTGAQLNQPGATNGAPAAAKPCPPPKVVIKNGGSDEPTVELKGKGSAEQAAQQRFITEQLTTATEENLKKISGRPLNPSEQETLSQIKQFMEQSKSALAAGDLGRAHNLSMKAHLLSDELVKP